MYSVLIVDDEEPVLESYSYLIDSTLDDFDVGGAVRSGNEAITAARARRPDVVLMDIAMPGMDGLDTIRELQHEFPDALYILSTAYERFDLAQRAIPLRVFAYLVKPVSRKRFMETMFRAKQELDEERSRLERRLEEAQHGEETIAREVQDFMLLLTWKPFDAGSWARYRNLFQLPSDHGVVLALDLAERDLYPRIAERVARRFRCLWTENLRRMIVFVADSAPPQTVHAFVGEIVQELAEPGASIGLSVGSRRRYDELYISCDEALNAIPAVSGSEEHLRRFRSRVRDFGQAVARARTGSDVGSLCQTLMDEAFATWTFPVARSRVAVAFERLLHDFDSRSGNSGASRSIADPVQDILEFETRKEVEAWGQRVARRLVEERTRHAGEHWPMALKHAVQYIDAHYAEQLQLTDVAEHCSVSSGYLSRLFTEHLSLSFTDHLNTVRLNVAQELLDEGDRSIKEIALSVGYQDPNYFSRIFRKFRGTSPTSFSRQERRDV